MLETNDINIGDYVEPIYDFLPEDVQDKNFEDLFGYVIEKKEDIITIEGIGRGMLTKGKVDNFRKAEVPEIIKNKQIVRIKE